MATTVIVTGGYAVSPAQNITISDPWPQTYPGLYHAGFVLALTDPSLPYIDFELDGTVSVSDNNPGSDPRVVTDFVYGVEDVLTGFNGQIWVYSGGQGYPFSVAVLSANSWVRIGATGVLNVTMAAGGGQTSAYGYQSGSGFIPFENDGAITVVNNGYGSAYGVSIAANANPPFGGQTYGPGLVVNQGSIDVTGGSGNGVELGHGASLDNSGTIAAHNRVGGVFVWAADTPTLITNSGHITADAGTYGGIGVFGTGGLTIINSGVITANVAIETNGSTNAVTQLILTNTGQITGQIIANSGFALPAGSFAGGQIHNSGAIHGEIDLNNGNDLYDGRGGTHTGALALGDGIDLAYLGNDGETVSTGGGVTVVYGGTGADTVYGGGGLDTIVVGGGDDYLNGGGGFNTVSFARATSGVTVNLGVTSSQNTGFGQDAIANFQDLVGSAFSDHLTGSAGNDIIDAGTGGDDVMDGGGGYNSASFQFASTGVTVSLALQGAPQATGIGADTLANFQGLIGSVYADHLTGGPGGFSLISGGAGGDDVLDGGGEAGNAVSFSYATKGVTVSLALQGQAQNTGVGLVTLTHFQNLFGSIHDDVLAGDSQDNVIDGGFGTNTVSYAATTAGVNVNLWTGTAYGTGSGHDTLSNIQSVIGSAYDDYITATGHSGRYDGGGGTNTVDFSHDPYGLTIDLVAGSAVDGHVTFALANIQNIVGTSQNDRILLGGGSHVVAAGAGINTIVLSPAGMGADEITDLSAVDLIDLEAFHNFHVFDQVLAAASQSGANTVINLGGGATLTLDGVLPSALTASQFIFGPPAVDDFAGQGASAVAFRNTTTGEWGFMTANPGGGQTWHAIGATSLEYDVVGKADFNGDGATDIAFRSHVTGDFGYMSVSGSTEVWHAVGSTSTAYDGLGAGDFNGDGVKDIAFRNPATGDFGYMSVNPGGGETWHALGPTSTGYDAIGVGDFNGDGLADVAFRSRTTGDLGFMSASLTLGPGVSAETWHPMGPTSLAYTALQPGDFNGDGLTDLPFRNPITGDWGYMSFSPGGGEAWRPGGATSTDYTPWETADINSDGLADVVYRSNFSGDWGYMSANPAGGEVWHGVGPSSLGYAVL